MASQIFVDIKVSPFVYYFFVSSNNSNFIRLKNNDHLWKIIWPKLICPPVGNKPIDSKYVLKVELFYLRSKDIKHANCLSDKSQNIINDYLLSQIKRIFHNYVLAFTSAGGTQQNGIEDFCFIYNIPLEEIKYDTLKKSWNRSYEKKCLHL